MTFMDECISLGLNDPLLSKDLLLVPSGETLSSDLKFFCLRKNDEVDSDNIDRSVVSKTNFDPILKNTMKTVFLILKNDNNDESNVNKFNKSFDGAKASFPSEKMNNELFQYGRLNENKALSSVFILDNVLLPLLRQKASFKAATQESNLRSSLHLTYAKKFASRVCQFTEQNENGIRLKIPKEISINKIVQGGDDMPDLAPLYKVAKEWIVSIGQAIDAELEQRHLKHIKGPMAEVDFWRRRYVVLSDIQEQVKSEDIKAALNVLCIDRSPLYNNLLEKINDLNKLSVEAKENAKFLSTLERHLRTLSDGPLEAIVASIPSLVDGMRMIWAVSRHYNRDDRMVPLMEMIANQIALRVKRHVRLKEIMDQQVEAALANVSVAKSILEIWKDSYMETRARIENMGQGHRRWEFDRTRLFESTDYMVEICSDTLQAIETIDELKHLLCPELVDITGENGNVFNVMNDLALLPKLLQDIQFDPFDRAKREHWSKAMETFNQMVTSIEEHACLSIERAFRKLRSSEGAYQFVKQFKTMKCRPFIHQILEARYQDILQQYEKELESVEDYFLQHKDNPPIPTGYLKASGSISWANGLYLRAKHPILLFQQSETLLSSGLGLKLKNSYLRFARSIDAFKERVFNDWSEHAHITSNQCLCEPLLRIQGDQCSVANSTHTFKTKYSAQQSVQSSMPTLIQVPTTYYVPQLDHALNSAVKNCVNIETNFSPLVRDLILETKNFDAMGYKIPEGAMHLTLQEQNLNRHAIDLDKFAQTFNVTFDSMSSIEISLMEIQIKSMNDTLTQGLSTLKWSSQRIQIFINAAFHAIERFRSKLSEVRKHLVSIEVIVKQIAQSSVVDEVIVKSVSSISDFAEIIKLKAKNKISRNIQLYQSISKILIKIEVCVSESNKGSSNLLQSSYNYWSRCMYNALVEMTCRSMFNFFRILRHFESEGLTCPLNISVTEKELTSEPSMSDFNKTFARCLRIVTESSRRFFRWMDQTCLDVESVVESNYSSETKQSYTFLNDVSRNSSVLSVLIGLNVGVYLLRRDFSTSIQNWKVYFDKVYVTDTQWKTELDKLTHSNSYSNATINQLVLDSLRFDAFEHGPLRSRRSLCLFRNISSTEVKNFLKDSIHERKLDFSDVVQHLCIQTVERVKKSIDDYSLVLSSEPSSFNEYKTLMNGIASVMSMNMSMELLCKDVEQKYNILHDNDFSVPQEEIVEAHALQSQWYNVVVHAKTIVLRLDGLKQVFREHLLQQCNDFLSKLKEDKTGYLNSGPGSPKITLENGLLLFEEWKTNLDRLETMKGNLIASEDLLDVQNTQFSDLRFIQESMAELEPHYKLYGDLQNVLQGLKSVSWKIADIGYLESFDKVLDTFFQRMAEIPRRHNLHVWEKIHLKLVGLQNNLTILRRLRNESMKDRHWFQLVGLSSNYIPSAFQGPISQVSFFRILEINLQEIAEEVDKVINNSLQEQKIENGLFQIINYWSSVKLAVKTYGDSSVGNLILNSMEENFIRLEDHMLNLQTMLSSKFCAVFRRELKFWEKRLNVFNECLLLWFSFQQKWMYLESIFVGADDLRVQLPHEAQNFDETSRAFQDIMRAVQEVPDIGKSCTSSNLHIFTQLLETLERCQKSLSEYLNTKRTVFARFYFVSNEDMINILGNSEPTSVGPHLMKLFENIKQLGFTAGNRKINEIHSSDGEHVKLNQEVECTGRVEIWMKSLEDEIKKSLHRNMKETVILYANQGWDKWIEANIGMCTISSSQIWWTWLVEDSFNSIESGEKDAMQRLEIKLSANLSHMVTMTQSALNVNTRRKVNSLLIINVHARDIVSSFVTESIMSAKLFEWESQLRFYWEKSCDDMRIKQCLGTFSFGYDYLGLNGRLVMTPLTDRCYMTLTQALTFQLGGSPSGPAGTGKTETVKDLAKALGVPCFVVNCGEGLDYLTMASTFSGLLQSGAWGCFDEFNRINIEVLSVVSSQLKAIQNAMISGCKTVNLGVGADIAIKTGVFGCFITMNPGYAGRTELPENLKSLFRPVAMVTPDMLLITENILFSQGFLHSRLLAKKVVTLYNLSKEQLSKQYHYDFGLRSMKAVLEMAGDMKRDFNELPEDELLMMVLRNANISRFVHEDESLFLGFINDLFPGCMYPQVKDNLLVTAIESYLAKELLDFKDSNEKKGDKKLAEKILQLYETQKTRHTTMLVGPTFTGKSTILQSLSGSLRILDGTTVKMFIINPKAQELNELYGTLDVLTRDWTDGILPHIFRKCNQSLPVGRSNERRWIVLDGDVDPIWVENLNSVMDDNRLLTLPNGERVRLQPHCSLICEVYDLQYASPATISRCGMVWVDRKNIGCKQFYHRWLRLRYNEILPKNELFMKLFHQYANPMIEFVLHGRRGEDVEEKLKQIVPVGANELCHQLCNTLDVFLPSIQDEVNYGDNCLSNVFIYSILYSIGGGLDVSSRIRFSEYLLELSGITVDIGGNLYDYYFCMDSNQWQLLDSKVTEYQEPSPFCFHKVFVPTKTTFLYQNLLMRLSPNCPVMLSGMSGSAKTVICEKYLSSLPLEAFSNLKINFSSITRSIEIKNFMDSKIEKRVGSTYGAPLGKKLSIFIDDIHLPKVDKYGTRQPIAMLLTLLDHGFYHCCKKGVQQKSVNGIQMIGAITSSTFGGDNLDPRFVSKFNILHVTKPSEVELKNIFSQILQHRVLSYGGSKNQTGTLVNLISSLSLTFFGHLNDMFQATPSKFHYIFTLSDLARVFEGLCSLNASWYNELHKLVRFWQNEIHRVFLDRMVTMDDVLLAESMMKQVLEDEIEKAQLENITASPMLFIDFDALNNVEDRYHGQTESDYICLREIFMDIIKYYNKNMQKPVSLVLFDYAIDHLLRILRVMKFPKGHTLLIGVGGSGKKCLTRIAAYAMGYTTVELEITKGYSVSDFCDEVKDILKLSLSQQVVFLLPDEHIFCEFVLETICNILNFGIPLAFFDTEEIHSLCEQYDCDDKGLANLCTSNLHIVLTMSPSGDVLKSRCQNFPSLVSACVVNWFLPWPKEALKMVCDHFISDDNGLLSKFANIDNISKHFTFVYMTVEKMAKKFSLQLKRRYQLTPITFIDNINHFRALVQKGDKENHFLLQRLEIGLKKISEASEEIYYMKIELHKKKITVDQKTKDVEQLITSIEEKTQHARSATEEATIKQKAAEEHRENIKTEKGKADAALMQALPALEAAAEALNNIRREDLQELKAFNNPPIHVKIVCQMCAILCPTGEKLEETWTDSKKMLGNPKLLDMLKDYSKETLTERMYQRCQKILKENKTHDISVQNMAHKSKAGKGLLVWVFAILKYYEMAKNVDPLRQKVKEMQNAQGKTEKEICDLKTLVSTLELQLQDLEKKYNDAKSELLDLQLQASQMQKRLSAATSLIDGLKGEKIRWTMDLKQLKDNHSMLLGDHLLFATFQSYLGAFTIEFRTELLEQCMNDLQKHHISFSEVFNPSELVLSNSILQQWFAKGLSKDTYSIQNGIMTMTGSRFPLCIDPQEQALKWIKNMYDPSQITTKTIKDKDYLKHLELALEYGKAFVFENVGMDLDAILNNLFSKSYFKDNGKKYVKIGDTAVEVDGNFRLFLCTKNNNPCYSPEIMSKLNLVNYSITQDGLADQLLNIVINHERPDLEFQHHELIHTMASNIALLNTLEDNLLKELSSSTGNILDNESLISTLQKTSHNVSSIKLKIEECDKMKEFIECARGVYKKVSRRGSILYFASSGLSSIDNMYEFSLCSFIDQFHLGMDDAEQSNELDTRINNLVESCTARVYKVTCLGMFDKHRMTYSFHLACMIMEEVDNDFDSNMMKYFTRGCLSLDIPAKPHSLNWLSLHSWNLLSSIARYNKKFNLLMEDLIHDVQFQNWIHSHTPELSEQPLINRVVFTNIEKLCIFKVFRPDRLYLATKLFVLEGIGDKYVKAPSLNYREIFNQSTSTNPIIFILTKGADPQSNVQKLGEQMGFHSPQRLTFISLGQGQAPVAHRLLEAAFLGGHWVMIQNCHLLLSWVNDLEALLHNFGTPHSDFRLWLTTESSSEFPLGLLHKSLKVVIEPPDGMRLNMQSTLSNMDPTALDSCSHPAFGTLLYCLIFLHAVLQERKKYGKLGWNIPYDFNESDLTISQQLMSTYLSKAWADGRIDVPWLSLRYLIGDVMYGGRVSDDMDRRILQTYFKEYFGDFLFSEGNTFCLSHHHNAYTVPDFEKGLLEEFTSHINKMPLVTEPVVLGLHEQTGLTFFADRMEDILSNLSVLHMSLTETENYQPRNIDIVSKVTDIVKLIPIIKPDIGSFEINTVRDKLVNREGDKLLSPCDIILLQDLEAFNNLCKCMYNSLNTLLRAYKGDIGMNGQLEDLEKSIHQGLLPEMWSRFAPPTTMKLQAWLSHFTQRHQQYIAWIHLGQPQIVWLSGLHFPQCYLSALLQTTCRKKGWALDQTIFYTEVTKFTDSNALTCTNNDDNGTFIKGLYIEGASWDIEKSKLTHQQSKSLVTELPIMKLVPIQKRNFSSQESLFRVPVYLSRRDASGKGLVFEAFLKTDIHHSFWILQSVAILMNT